MFIFPNWLGTQRSPVRLPRNGMTCIIAAKQDEELIKDTERKPIYRNVQFWCTFPTGCQLLAPDQSWLNVRLNLQLKIAAVLTCCALSGHTQNYPMRDIYGHFASLKLLQGKNTRTSEIKQTEIFATTYITCQVQQLVCYVYSNSSGNVQS